MSLTKKPIPAVLLALLVAAIMLMGSAPPLLARALSTEMQFDKEFTDSYGTVYQKAEIIEADLSGTGHKELVVVYKGTGTSSLLSYQVWHQLDSQWLLWHEAENLYQGVVEVQNKKLVEKTPLYQKGDANGQPSSYLEKVYRFTDEGLLLFDEQEKSAQFSLFSGPWVNPPRAEIEATIRRIALEKGAPPVIVKAIAYAESTFRQFSNGQPLQSFDGHSWGIMQVSPRSHPQYDVERLKYDLEYNIAAGIEILISEKWAPNYTTIGNADPRIMENWYFTIWAYNGWSGWNNPNSPGPYGVYQDKVLGFAKSQFGQTITPVPPSQLPATGTPPSSVDYPTPQPARAAEFRSHQAGDRLVAVGNLTLRTASGANIGGVPRGTEMEVLSGPVLHNKYIRYQIKTNEPNPQTGWVAMNWVLPVGGGHRLAGTDRYSTAVAISLDSYPQARSASAVVISRCDDFADALPGGVLAAQKGGPLLLSRSNSLPTTIASEITRVLKDGGTIYLLGGSGAVSDNVLTSLEGLGNYNVKRISGANREATALEIAQEINSTSRSAIIASSRNFPDALAISSYAAQQGIPLLLTPPGSLSEHAAQYLNEQNINNVYVIGGDAAVSEAAFQQIAAIVGSNNTKRFGGTNRYDTSRIIAQQFFTNPSTVAIAYGRNFPDALAGSVNAAAYNAPMLLVESNSVPSGIRQYLTANKESIQDFIIYGGTGPVSNSVAREIETLIQ